MKPKTNFLFFLFLTFSLVVKADPYAYTGKVLITSESENFIVNHYHNWTDETKDELYEMITTDQNPFTDKNNYGYIELLDKKTGAIIFKKPSTALTQILISKNEKHIVGISKIIIDNPYQLIIYDVKGKLIKKRNFSSEESRLTSLEYDKFSKEYPRQKDELLEFTYSENGFLYIDFLRINMPIKLGKEVWSFLYKKIVPNHLTPNIHETTTNFVYWFSESNPEITLNYNNESLISLNINDTENRRIEISILE